MQLPTSVQATEPTPGFPVYLIDHARCRARVALHGAHVMEWQPSSAPKPVLYLSPKAVFQEGKAIRGGIPICWPWFNASPDGLSGPSHGVARTQFWELVSVDEDEGGVTLVMTLEHDCLTATATISLGEKLTVALDTRNVGKEASKVSGALHTYLSIDEITRITIGGLAGRGYLDTVGEPTRRTQDGPVVFEGEVDRIYEHAGMCRLDDPGMDRVIVVEKKGSPSTVVWNPWTEKAAGIPDLPIDSFMEFVCIEAAIANDVAVELAPGASHQLETTLSIAS